VSVLRRPFAVLLLAALSVAGVVSAASASLGAPKVHGVSAYAYVAPAHAYDGVAHGAQVHVSAVAPVAWQNVSDGVQRTAVTTAGPLSVWWRLSVAANSDLATVTTHLDSIDALASHPPNAAMVSGIEDAIASGRPLTAAEQNFMTHELTEARVVASGASQDAAHAAALETHPPFMNYSPEVIQNFPEYFNSNWRTAWGIE